MKGTRRIRNRATAIAFVAMVSACSLHAQQDLCGIAKLAENAASFYPHIAQAAHVSGEVVQLVSFDHDGHSTITRVISGPDMLREASSKLVEASTANPSEGSRECPITVEFHLTPVQYGNGCDVTNSAPNAIATTPGHLDIFALGLGPCDPAVTITRTCRRFLFFKKCSKPTDKTNE